uniref:merozoite surface antigen 2-like n=1 Tax=Lonchura striata TaxID=40157 RepID=UPI000B4C5F88|nr:merozoite surface antigen 2-like [Lonchura striata domestica]
MPLQPGKGSTRARRGGAAGGRPAPRNGPGKGNGPGNGKGNGNGNGKGNGKGNGPGNGNGKGNGPGPLPASGLAPGRSVRDRAGQRQRRSRDGNGAPPLGIAGSRQRRADPSHTPSQGIPSQGIPSQGIPSQGIPRESWLPPKAATHISVRKNSFPLACIQPERKLRAMRPAVPARRDGSAAASTYSQVPEMASWRLMAVGWYSCKPRVNPGPWAPVGSAPPPPHAWDPPGRSRRGDLRARPVPARPGAAGAATGGRSRRRGAEPRGARGARLTRGFPPSSDTWRGERGRTGPGPRIPLSPFPGRGGRDRRLRAASPRVRARRWERPRCGAAAGAGARRGLSDVPPGRRGSVRPERRLRVSDSAQ